MGGCSEPCRLHLGRRRRDVLRNLFPGSTVKHQHSTLQRTYGNSILGGFWHLSRRGAGSLESVLVVVFSSSEISCWTRWVPFVPSKQWLHDPVKFLGEHLKSVWGALCWGHLQAASFALGMESSRLTQHLQSRLLSGGLTICIKIHFTFTVKTVSFFHY